MTNGRSTTPRHRPAAPKSWSTGQFTWATTSTTLARLVMLALVLLGIPLGASSSAQAADGAPTVKVFVVPDDGQQVTLRKIANATLNDPGRATEIFDLNVDQAQPDGGSLSVRGEKLQPGWILRLPADASGPDVRLARDNSQGDNGGQDDNDQNDAGSDEAAGTDDNGANSTGTTPVAAETGVTIPLQLLVAGLVAVLLACVTVGIVARRRISAVYHRLIGSLDSLREPARMRRRLAERRAIASTFAADGEHVRRAYEALSDFGPRPGHPERPVHALQVDATGVTAWLTSTDRATAPWKNLDASRWRRPADASAPMSQNGQSPVSSATPPCLVRAGVDDDGHPLFVDLSRLDGVLSVTGPLDVARQVVENLLSEVGRSWPDLPVTVLAARGGVPPVAIPSSLGDVVQIPDGAAAAIPSESDVAHGHGSVRTVAARRPVRGLAVMAGTPTEQQAAELSTLAKAGWTGLVCGEAAGAHWRWETDARGGLHIPVLGLRLTAPA